MKYLSNIFQLSTLRAVAVLLSAFGLTVPEPLVQAVSTVGLMSYGAWETLRDAKKGGAQ